MSGEECPRCGAALDASSFCRGCFYERFPEGEELKLKEARRAAHDRVDAALKVLREAEAEVRLARSELSWIENRILRVDRSRRAEEARKRRS